MLSKATENRGFLHLVAIGTRTAFFAALWWGLAEGAADSWIIGVPIVIVATLVSSRLSGGPRTRFRLGHFLVFVTIFVIESLRGAIDVAVRATTLNIVPNMVNYELTLKAEAARAFFAGTISLLPGTLVADTKDNVLQIHSLDARQSIDEPLKRIEQRIGAIFGESI